MPGATSTSQPEAKKMPCGHTMGGRNLIVCIDGTANQFGDMNTNVIELYNLILKGSKENQLSWYNSGIGTYARPSWRSPTYYKQVLSHKIDLAIAWNFEKTLKGAYRWLSDRYKDGDCIFLFARMELYADEKTGAMEVTQVGSQAKMSKAERFKSAFSHPDVKVHFVGAWDTVSSIGIARGNKMLPLTIDGMEHVCYFRHALALDERRVKFLPEYTWGGTTKPRRDTNEQKEAEVDKAGELHVEQGVDPTSVSRQPPKSEATVRFSNTLEVWFAGTHSDIGGGNVENAGMDRSRPPLRWMVFEAGAVGLRMAPFKRELTSHEQIAIKESLTPAWWPFELLPFRRLTFTRDGRKDTTRKPHLGSSRKIHDGQKIHSSLLLADEVDSQPSSERRPRWRYTPKARPPPIDGPDSFWETLRKEGLTGPTSRQWLELDLHESAASIVERVTKNDSVDAMLGRMRDIAQSAEGRKALYTPVFDAILRKPENLEVKIWYKLLRFAANFLRRVFEDDKSAKRLGLRDVHHLLLLVLESDSKDIEQRRSVRDFVMQFASPCLHVLEKHKEAVLCVAFSPDGERIASGSYENTICIWDAETGTLLKEPFEGHTGPVNSIAFSPDGKCIISGSFDATIRVWDAETGKTVVGPIKGHTGDVNSVAFSPDGSRVVSGSDDETVRIWDTETGKPVGEPLWGYTRIVFSVAFSLDGKRVVSGSSDCMVRIWDAETGNAVREPLQGHTDWVRSVAFSPDGTRIISGSDDGTIRIWDATTGETVVGPIRGHTSSVLSATYSPDGQYVVSGSGDETVRIWDAEMGKQVGEPLRGHTGWVYSVAFSPDGKCIASGSWDETVRIWDVETWVKVARLDSVEKATI
ncbi:hypothetical protein NLJ89_g6020 [Agrocybe chaxingu]|uniref:T6SS Phospholipase effector Tle1-like catalytic domain-containing protein n=1 Tax=Agrocybe chaxingu TaxID=84603 RepID=A0A9W8MWU2_9AGAR|nr:hypothetical protein NLJ89_g6020 [Agrocybe chaxingu]